MERSAFPAQVRLKDRGGKSGGREGRDDVHAELIGTREGHGAEVREALSACVPRLERCPDSTAV